MHIVKIFKSGRSRAIRIPKDFAYEGGAELTVRKIGEKLIMEPVRKSWLTLYDEIEPLGADDDFLADRPDLSAIDEDRVKSE
ncbi:MAG: type II toxin-antitoxin system VapB family antitoxin [Candidatus Dadabacteria bacterium]|nr:type II toxin-antitoxin system VapB family antitoxin [Candidatus Dadabacteria bacterium]